MMDVSPIKDEGAYALRADSHISRANEILKSKQNLELNRANNIGVANSNFYVFLACASADCSEPVA